MRPFSQVVCAVRPQEREFSAGRGGTGIPIDWPEPFGLVMIEAMACGTPVIAFRRGSVPEVIDHGATGFVVENEDEAVQAVARLDELDRRSIRAVFERRFTATCMTNEYLRHYRALPGLALRTEEVDAHPLEPRALATDGPPSVIEG